MALSDVGDEESLTSHQLGTRRQSVTRLPGHKQTLRSSLATIKKTQWLRNSSKVSQVSLLKSSRNLHSLNRRGKTWHLSWKGLTPK